MTLPGRFHRDRVTWLAYGALCLGRQVANLYPLSLAVGMAAVPDRSGLASARL